MKRVLIIQTAFLGDVILTLPVVQVLKKEMPDVSVDCLAIPSVHDILKNHPGISKVILYDKRGAQKSFVSLLKFRKELRDTGYDAVICPHRSVRSAFLASGTRAPIRIGFDRSSRRSAFTSLMPWRFGVREIERNLSLLSPIGIPVSHETPTLFPSDENRAEVDSFLRENRIVNGFAVVAPGTVWATKQYPVDRMALVAEGLLGRFANVVVIGGNEDAGLAETFTRLDQRIVSAAGKFPIMSSAELIRRSSLLVSNDSAPVHIASAFEIPTVAIFGPTVKDFGFFPYNKRSAVVETKNLGCRPCSIHGGKVCPIRTFDCMMRISPEDVLRAVDRLLESKDE